VIVEGRQDFLAFLSLTVLVLLDRESGHSSREVLFSFTASPPNSLFSPLFLLHPSFQSQGSSTSLSPSQRDWETWGTKRLLAF